MSTVINASTPPTATNSLPAGQRYSTLVTVYPAPDAADFKYIWHTDAN